MRGITLVATTVVVKQDFESLLSPTTRDEPAGRLRYPSGKAERYNRRKNWDQGHRAPRPITLNGQGAQGDPCGNLCTKIVECVEKS